LTTHPNSARRFSWPLLCLLAAGAGCGERAAATVPGESADRSPVYADSIFPIEEEIRRFRATLDTLPSDLGPNAPASRDQLVRQFVTHLDRADTAAAAALMITKAEFGTLYYEHTRYTRPPYRMSPALLWFLTVQNSEKGLGRALAAYAGSGVRLASYRCEAEPRVEGPNRIWQDCPLELERPDGVRLQKRLFAGILERNGRFKFVSLANDF
jgi:hypothetical protein